MIRAALYLKKKLENGYLAKAFHSDPVGSLADSCTYFYLM